MKRITTNTLFMNAFHSSAIGMAIVSKGGKWLKVNSSLCKILGYAEEELEQMLFQEITYPDDIELDLRNVDRMLKGEIQNYEIAKRYFHKKGHIVWGLLSVSLVKDENQTPLYFISQIQDVTAHKELQDRLKKSEERYRNLIQYSPEPMATYYEGRLTYINEEGVKLIGAKNYKELIGKNIGDFIHPDYKEIVYQRSQKMLSTNRKLESIDIKLIDLNGKEIDVRISSNPINDQGKQEIQVLFSNITEKKRIEKELKKSNEKFKAIFEKSDIGIALLDRQGNVVETNQTYLEIFSDCDGLIVDFNENAYSEDLVMEGKLFTELIEGKRLNYKMEKRYFRKDGTIQYTYQTVTLLKNIEDIYAISMVRDKTKGKQSKQLIKESEQRYRALVESSANGIILHQEGKIVYANPRIMTLLKATAEEQFIGQPIIKFVHPDYHEIVRHRIQQLDRNIPVGSIEEKYICLDGSILDVEVIATPIEYMDKPAFQVIIHDITKRKEMENRLNKTQEQYRSVVENVKEVIFQTDVQGTWTFLNPAWEIITGFKVNESIGDHYNNYIYRDDQEQNDNQFLSLIRGENESARQEVRYVTKDGGYCWVEVFAKATLNEQGQIIGTLGTLNDITKRKESEAELIASEERFRLLAEYSSDMISLHDVNGKYLYASPACKEILQYKEDELVGKDAYLFIHPEDQAVIKEHHQDVLNNGYTVSTYRIRRKNGEYVWFESAIRLLDELHTGAQKQIVVSRNITERKLTEQKLQEANEILQQLSSIDGLTGVSNRREFDERLEKEWRRSLRNSTALSLIMFDIDYFKAYNDTYGHQGGDGCLIQIATAIKETLGRSTDLICRYGGEEFCAILPETNEEGAKRVGEKIRAAIEALEIPHSGSKILPWVTISAGTATMIPTKYTSSKNLISNADKAVYQAKHSGRNCVCYYE